MMAASSVDRELESLFREIADSYTDTPMARKDVVEFTKKTLQGEYIKLSPGDEVFDCLKKMKNQGQISSTKTGLLEYFANASKTNPKHLKEEVNRLKRSHTKAGDVTDFIGRDGDVAAVTSILSSESNIVHMYGDQGVGKTTLAVKVADNIAMTSKQTHLIDLEHARDIHTVMLAILLDFHSSKLLIMPREEVVYEVIENLEKLTVLILDNVPKQYLNVADGDEGITFVKLLKGMVEHDKGRKLKIFLTSQVPLPEELTTSAVNYHVNPLTTEKAAKLLKDVHLDDSKVEKIIQLCKNNPLLLQTTRAMLKEKLVQPQKMVDAFNTHPCDSVNILIQTFEKFSFDMKKIAIGLSLFQGPFTVSLAAKLLKCSPNNAGFFLCILKNRHFITQRRKKYSMHSLAKEVLLRKSIEKNYQDIYTETKETFFNVFAKRVKEMAGLLDQHYMKMYSRIQRDKPNLNLAFRISFESGFLLTSSDFSESSQIAGVLQCLVPGHERADLFRKWSQIALNKGEWISYIHLTCMLILVVLEKTTGKDEARKLVPKVKEALDKVTDDKSSQSYRLAESSYNYVQGEVAFADFTCGMSSQSHFEAGLQCHNQCLQTRRELLGDHNETVYCLNAIGNYYMELKDHQKALDYYTEILDTKQRLTGGKVQLDAPVYSNQIACVHEEMGKKFRDESRESRQPRRKQLYERAKEEFQHAISKYQEALDLERKLHISGYANTAAFYRNMSTSYSFLEEYDQALVCAKKALSIRKKVLGTDANTLRSYYQVGIVYEKLGNHDKALKYVYKAYNMELSLPPGERSRVKLRVTDKIGNLCGDLDEAKEYDSRSVLADDDVLTSDDEKDDENSVEEDDILCSDGSSSDFDGFEGTTTVAQQQVERIQETHQDSDVQPSHSKEPASAVKSFDITLESDSQECSDIHESQSIGAEGYCWNVKSTGVLLCFERGTLLSDTMITCHLYTQYQVPLEPMETLVSWVVSLEAKALTLNKNFTMVIPHCGPTNTPGYEVVVKEFCKETKTWKELDSCEFTKIQSKRDRVDQKGRIDLTNIKVPSILLTRKDCGIISVTSRLVTDTLSIGLVSCTLTSTVFPKVVITVKGNTVKDTMSLSLKVQPLPPRFLKTENFFCGPVLHIDKSTSTDILEPVAVCFPHPLSWHGDNTPRCGEVRVLHRARDNWNDEWLDITDDISTCMDQDMVSIEVKHFSMFWPIWIEDRENIHKLFNKAKSLLSTLCGSSPVSAWCCVEESGRVGKGKAILQLSVMPSHLAPDEDCNCKTDLYNEEEIVVELRGGVSRHIQEDLPGDEGPFTIKFSSRKKTSSSMHVRVFGEFGYCLFLSGLKPRACVCKLPYLPPDFEQVHPLEYFGIPLDDKVLLETSAEVLFKFKNDEHETLRKIAGESLEISSEEKAIKSFYQQITHTAFEEHAFCVLVSSLASLEGGGGLHVKERLEAGKKVVEKVLDLDIIKSISSKIQENCISIATALSLSKEYETISKQFKCPKDCCFVLLKTWLARNGDNANLHSLMKILLKTNSKDGVQELLCQYKELLDNLPSSQTQEDEKCLTSTFEGQVECLSSTFEGQNECLSSTFEGQEECLSSTFEGQEECLPSSAEGQEESLSSSVEGQDNSLINTVASCGIDSDEDQDGLPILYPSLCVLVVAASYLLFRYIRR